MTARELDCNEIVELVTDYLEGAMDARTAAAFEEHLIICEGCRQYVEQIRRTIETSGRLSGSSLSGSSLAGSSLSGPAEDVLVAAFRQFHRPA